MTEVAVHSGHAAPVSAPASRILGDWTFATCAAAEAAAFRARWAALADASAGDNVFFHPDFVLPATRYLDAGVEVATVATVDGRLVAATPFKRTRLGHIAPAVRLWSHDYAPLGLPLIDGTVVGNAMQALMDGLAPADGRVNLIVPDLPTDGAVAAALIAAATREGRPVDILGAHERAVFLRGDTKLSAKRRKKFSRQRDLLAAAAGGEVAFETVNTPSAVRRRFEDFLALEKSGWKGSQRTALASSEATESFSAEAVTGLATHGGVRIDSLVAADRPVAMLVTLTGGKTAFTWKIAYDEALARFSPGAQVMAHVSDAADGPLIERVDSCATANHPMVDTLWSSRVEIATFVVGPAGGSLMNRAGVLAAKAELAARRVAKAALRR